MSSSQQTAIQVSIHREKKRSKPQGFEGRRLAKIVGTRADADEGKMLALFSANMAKVKPFENSRNRTRHVRPHDSPTPPTPDAPTFPSSHPPSSHATSFPRPARAHRIRGLSKKPPTPPLAYVVMKVSRVIEMCYLLTMQSRILSANIIRRPYAYE